MADYNSKLGQKIHKALEALELESPITTLIHPDHAFDTIKASHLAIMRALGLDDTDDSLMGTPKRVAKMYQDELFYGLNYDNFPEATAFDNKAGLDEMVLTRCSVFSTCEHHFLPFIGEAYIAYIPGKKLLGLSKFSRVTDFFARRPQVQERLTAQISAALREILETDDVAVVINCEHYCGKIRGVQEHNGMMLTSQLDGKFRTVPELRQEFMAATRMQK